MPTVVNWRKNKTIEKGRYVESVIVWKIVAFPVTVRLGHANDN